jgi:CRISPR-associated endonuclease/helicase Cas3
VFDPNHTEAHAFAISVETPRRFARLQLKYGRWGLAYLESLVRASDILASQEKPGEDEPAIVVRTLRQDS